MLALPPGDHVFKLVVVDPSGATHWELGANRRLHVPLACVPALDLKMVPTRPPGPAAAEAAAGPGQQPPSPPGCDATAGCASRMGRVACAVPLLHQPARRSCLYLRLQLTASCLTGHAARPSPFGSGSGLPLPRAGGAVTFCVPPGLGAPKPATCAAAAVGARAALLARPGSATSCWRIRDLHTPPTTLGGLRGHVPSTRLPLPRCCGSPKKPPFLPSSARTTAAPLHTPAKGSR